MTVVARRRSPSPTPGRVRRNPRGHSWCGPTALTVLTGFDYQTCRDAIAAVTGNQRVMGVRDSTMGVALRRLLPGANFRAFLVFGRGCIPDRPTLAQFLRLTRETRDAAAFYLVILTGHYVVIRGRKLFDNQTPEGGAFLSAAPHRRSRVTSVWQLIRP